MSWSQCLTTQTMATVPILIALTLMMNGRHSHKLVLFHMTSAATDANRLQKWPCDRPNIKRMDQFTRLEEQRAWWARSGARTKLVTMRKELLEESVRRFERSMEISMILPTGRGRSWRDASLRLHRSLHLHRRTVNLLPSSNQSRNDSHLLYPILLISATRITISHQSPQPAQQQPRQCLPQ